MMSRRPFSFMHHTIFRNHPKAGAVFCEKAHPFPKPRLKDPPLTPPYEEKETPITPTIIILETVTCPRNSLEEAVALYPWASATQPRAGTSVMDGLRASKMR